MSRKHRKVTTTPKYSSSVQHSMVDIVIPVYGRFDILQKCLISIPQAMGDIPYKLYIVDNGSPKEEADEFYSQFQYPIVIIRNKENLGFPRACNIAAKRGTSPLIFFLNSDVLLNPFSVPLLVKEFDDPKVGICGMKLVFPPETESVKLRSDIRPANKIQHVGLMVNIRREIYHIFVGWDADNPRPNSMREPLGITGAALMIRRNLFVKAGYFSEIYGGGTYEDMDICMMAKELGYNVIVNTKACGIHYVGATAETYKAGFNLNFNYNLFMQRWGNKLTWNEYKVW